MQCLPRAKGCGELWAEGHVPHPMGSCTRGMPTPHTFEGPCSLRACKARTELIPKTNPSPASLRPHTWVSLVPWGPGGPHLHAFTEGPVLVLTHKMCALRGSSPGGEGRLGKEPTKATSDGTGVMDPGRGRTSTQGRGRNGLRVASPGNRVFVNGTCRGWRWAHVRASLLRKSRAHGQQQEGLACYTQH